jgi:hypothetical protein
VLCSYFEDVGFLQIAISNKRVIVEALLIRVIIISAPFHIVRDLLLTRCEILFQEEEAAKFSSKPNTKQHEVGSTQSRYGKRRVLSVFTGILTQNVLLRPREAAVLWMVGDIVPEDFSSSPPAVLHFTSVAYVIHSKILVAEWSWHVVTTYAHFLSLYITYLLRGLSP